MRVADFTPLLRRAIEQAREAGLAQSAADLEDHALAAYTTSSEWLGEVGEAILRFRAREGDRVPAPVIDLLNQCLVEVGKVWPTYAPGPLRSRG